MYERNKIRAKWLTSPCDCEIMRLHNRYICEDGRKEFASIVDVVSQWQAAMLNISKLSFTRSGGVTLVRYEDLVMRPIATLNKIARDLKLAVPDYHAIKALLAPSKAGGAGLTIAKQKIVNRTYLQGLKQTDIKDICRQLDLPRFHELGYATDCA